MQNHVVLPTQKTITADLVKKEIPFAQIHKASATNTSSTGPAKQMNQIAQTI